MKAFPLPSVRAPRTAVSDDVVGMVRGEVGPAASLVGFLCFTQCPYIEADVMMRFFLEWIAR